MITKKLGYLASTAIVASLALSGNAFAQADDEIIVTATKRETTLQATPVAVTVTTADTIEKARILDLQDLQSVVPSLRVNQLQTSQNVNFIVRGFGNGANNAGIEPSVGVFIDGVYRSRSAAQIGDLPKLERAEVLSGPQSTLFGKNASAGVVSITTAAPKYETQGHFELGVGSFSEFVGKAYVTTGVSENVAVSLGGSYNTRNGFFESVAGQSAVNDKNRWNIRGQALIEPSDATTIRLIADYSQIDEICCAVTNIINEGAAGALQFLGGPNAIADANDPFALNSYFDSDPVNTVDDYGVSMQIDHDFANFALTSISSYRSNSSFYDQDADYSSLDSLTVSSDQEIDTITQELRLTSTTGEKLDWMVGGYFFSEDINQVGGLDFGVDTRPYFDVLLGGPDTLAGLEPLYGVPVGTWFGDQTQTVETFTQDNTAWSIFGSADYHLSDRLTVTGGLNYTNDKKTVTGSTVNNELFASLDLFNTPTLLGVPLPDVLLGAELPNLFLACGATDVPTLLASPACGGPLAGLTGAQAFGAVQAGVNAGVQGLQGLQFQPQFLAFPNSVEDGKTDDSKLTWTARVAYEANDNLNVYASAATGFKSTSWNLARDSRPFASDEAALVAAGLNQNNQTYTGRFANPEDAFVLEVGMKGKFNNGSFNLAVFDQTIKDFQGNAFVGGGFILTNAGQTSVRGFEVGAKYNPTDRLSVGFDATVLDSNYDSFTNAPGPGLEADGSDNTVDLTGRRVGAIPTLAFSTFLNYEYEFNNGMTSYFHADYQHESEVPITNVLRTITPERAIGITRQIDLVNASVGLKMENGFGVQLWAKNIFGDEFLRSIFPGVAQTGIVNAYRNSPGTYGINLRKTF